MQQHQTQQTIVLSLQESKGSRLGRGARGSDNSAQKELARIWYCRRKSSKASGQSLFFKASVKALCSDRKEEGIEVRRGSKSPRTRCYDSSRDANWGPIQGLLALQLAQSLKKECKSRRNRSSSRSRDRDSSSNSSSGKSAEVWQEDVSPSCEVHR